MHHSKIHCEQPNEASLSCYQTYRSTPGEAARLKAHARAAGVSVSELTRRRVHGHQPPVAAAPPINLEAYASLARTTANLNQLTQHSNEQRAAGIPVVLQLAQLKALLQKLLSEVNDLRGHLVGAAKNKCQSF